MCIPAVDEAVFYRAIDELVKLDHRWIPRKRGQAFYIRPLIVATELQLEVRPARRYRFLVMSAPVRAYFDTDAAAVALSVEERFTRASPGGTGDTKTAGNYGASLYPGRSANAAGYAQVLWLDGVEHRYVEEVGAINIFFRFRDRVVTPALRGTILPGVTRDSVITLLRDRGVEVEEGLVSIDEVIDDIRSGELMEAFGAGTAAIIAPVGKIACRGKEWIINDYAAGELTRELYDTITGIQLGEIEDRYGWNRLIRVENGAQERLLRASG